MLVNFEILFRIRLKKYSCWIVGGSAIIDFPLSELGKSLMKTGIVKIIVIYIAPSIS